MHTVRTAVVVPPVPPSTEVTAPVVLTSDPSEVAVTLTLKVHEEFAASVPPVRLTLFEAATAVMVPAPHVPMRPFGVETTRPAGNVSVKPTPVSAVAALGLVIV